MKSAMIALTMLCTVSVHAQELKTSLAYPLEAHVIKVEIQTASRGTSGLDTDPTTGAVSGGGGGGTYTWHLMRAVIGGTLYGLSVPNGVSIYGISVQHHDWLEIGTYPAKRVMSGFEFQYLDSAGKVRHEVLRIESEESAPSGVPTATLSPTLTPAVQTPEPATNAPSDKHSYYAIKTGNDLLALCSAPENPEGGEFDWALCAGYFRGVQDTLGDLSASGVKTPISLCFGDKSDKEARDIAVKFIRNNPTIRNEDAAAVAMAALSQAFPCSKSGRKFKGE